jgi:hypothetical protein
MNGGQGQGGDIGLYEESTARIIQSAFKLCVSDRSNPPTLSLRKGVYRTASCLMGWYFKIDRTNLSKQLVRAVNSDPTLPALESYKMADRVTWSFYLGLLAFRAGEDEVAGGHLGWAFERCLAGSRRNQE